MRAVGLLLLLAAPAAPVEQGRASFESAVEQYRAGHTQAALEAMVWLGADGLRQSGTAVERGSATVDRRAAAMLHTDTAEVLWRINRSLALRHIDVARLWADAVTDPLQAFRSRWYLAAGLLLVERGSQDGTIDPALDHFEQACQKMPNDVAMLTVAAWLQERMALVPAPVSVGRDATPERARKMKQSYLATAKARLETALRIDPLAAEAALRLARVRMLLDDRAGARHVLEPLLARPEVADRISYLARLFLARVLEQEQQRERALALYREAIGRVPGATSARLGLALLLHRSNDTRAATEALMPVIRETASTAMADPWAEYLNANIDQAKALRRMLRAEVQQ